MASRSSGASVLLEFTVEQQDRLLDMILHPEKVLADLEAEVRRNREAWAADPYFPIRNLRTHGVEPSEGALNTLDGPCRCDFCGATDHGDGEALHPAEVMCYGCGHVVCDRCATPPNTMGRHEPDLHRSGSHDQP